MNERVLIYNALFDGSAEDNLKAFGFSSTIVSRLKKVWGALCVNGAPAPLVVKVIKGDALLVTLRDDPCPRPEYVHKIDIVYEDEDLAVIDKPPDLAVIETMPHYGKSLPNVLQTYWGDFVYRPVNRLDRQTSGLMAVAKNSLAHSVLSTGKKAVTRKYYAVVQGRLESGGTIDAPIAKADDGTVRRVVDASGQRAVTFFTPVKIMKDRTLLDVTLATGRTHQIRVHCAHIGHPLLGDGMYGGDTREIDRQALHSRYAAFEHPISGRAMSFDSPIPDDMRALID